MRTKSILVNMKVLALLRKPGDNIMGITRREL